MLFHRESVVHLQLMANFAVRGVPGAPAVPGRSLTREKQDGGTDFCIGILRGIRALGDTRDSVYRRDSSLGSPAAFPAMLSYGGA